MMGGKLVLLAGISLAAAAGASIPSLPSPVPGRSSKPGKPEQPSKKTQADVDALDKAEAKRRRKAERNKGMNQNAKKWLASFEAELKRKYGITVEDTGWEGAELHERYGATDPSTAVDSFGEKYGLIPIIKF